MSRFARQMDALLRYATPVAAGGRWVRRGEKPPVAVTFDDGFASVLHNALPILAERGIPATMFVTTGYLGQQPGWAVADQGDRLVTPDELRRLPADLVEIGSHTVSHAYLARLTPEEVATELTQSKHRLESILGREVGLVSCPYGSVSPEVLGAARAAGYRRVFASATVGPQDLQDGFLSPRFGVTPDDWAIEFWLKLRGRYAWLATSKGLRWRQGDNRATARVRHGAEEAAV